MLMPQVHQSHSIKTLSQFRKPFIHGTSHTSLSVQTRRSFNKTCKTVRIGLSPCNIKAIASVTENSVSVKAVINVKLPVVGRDDLKGKTILLLELVSTELDSNTGLKDTIKGYALGTDQNHGDFIKYESEFKVPAHFGEIGAVRVENEHKKEIYISDIVLDDGLPNGPVNVSCRSWIHSKYDNPDQKRVFFTNKSYLPSQTPEGLKGLREEELVILRGNGQGERKEYERIYDYDVYNDLGNPDSGLERSVLGGKEHPYPRRCRTGRPPCDKDPFSEKRSSNIYVPRDECFSEKKKEEFDAKKVGSFFHAVVPTLETDSHLGFPHFEAIDELFNELPPQEKQGFFLDLWTGFLNFFKYKVLRFETPSPRTKDKSFWSKDEEFARETLAGLNPYSIQLVTEWPLKSKLDPQIYGQAESAITTELIEQEIRGIMTVEEAIKQKKIFILDYHDLLLPYVVKVKTEGKTLYGSRTLFFLTPDNTLRPLAIELVRPPMDGKLQWKKVYTSSRTDGAGPWLWKLAKAHVLAHDSGHHQLVSHWLRTHCATEPYIIATNRQLSAMHPIYRLLHPHFRYTMEINALAREALINAGGIIESSFSPAMYSMELSSVAYDLQWRFDYQALPADLISRGLAVEDPTAPHGLKLTIEDYPFANDGLILWDAIKQWVTDYVNHYYPDSSLVQSDKELQEWWTEIRTVGHGDKKDEPWWPVLKTPQDLIGIITTIVWVASAHHAAVNFGQYAYAGYFPNRPAIARMNMPDEDPKDEDWKFFMEKPEAVILTCYPSQIQATRVMAVLDVLSNHSPDEEYIGEKVEPSWGEEPNIKAAFEKFSGKLKELEGVIDERNANCNLKNRNGVGILPYELLKPFSEPGVTGKGVPFSISI